MKNNIPHELKRDKKSKREIMFHGIPASPGIAHGTIKLVHDVSSTLLNPNEYKNISPEQVEEEIQHFKSAIEETRVEIKELRNRVQASLENHEANIFDAHFLIVDDRMLMNEVCMLITKKQLQAEAAFSQTMQKYIAAISAVADPYLRERASDVKDVAARIISHLQGLGKFKLDHLPGPCIIVAKDLTPSDTALLDRANVLAFAIESGSKTSHSAILARSMKIPAVVGMNRFVECLEDGDSMIIDGFLGIAILNPTPDTVELYKQKEKGKAKLYSELLRETQLLSETTDGYRIQLAANMESADNIVDVKKYGAAGVGLFRTEYLFMNTEALPGEEVQFEVYKKVAEAAEGQPVVIRTLDLGGDKLSSALGSYHEQNPFLGLRAIRLCLDNPSIFKTQMRAILRAGAFGNIHMMFPMVACMDELNQALDLLEEIKSDLKNSNMKFNGKMKIGIMIEIPSAALIADKLAKKADFFSIGTNDLVQYTLAVDRNNERVAGLYQPTHPAVLELIARTTQAASENSIWTGVCGEMAGDPRYVPILIGLGVRELSMSPLSIGHIRRLIRRISMHEAEKIAEKALAADTAEEALRYSTEFMEKKMPEILSSMRGG